MSSLDRSYWRSLDELADKPAFRRFLEREFPAYADEMLQPASRRGFLKVMGASLALAGMTACRWPREEILPFTQRPAGYVPGVPLRYATALELDGASTGLLATSHDGRPIKIEGNPLHPESRGATTAVAQASLLELYDPDRSRSPRGPGGADETWSTFERAAGEKFAAVRESGGAGLRFLAAPDSSPTMAAAHERVRRAFPASRLYEYTPLSRDNVREGARLAFDRPLRSHLHLDKAEIVVALDDDLLQGHPAALTHARDYAAGRRPDEGRQNRLYAIESTYSLTGAMADHRIRMPSKMIATVASCLAAELFLELGLLLPAYAEELRRTLERFQFHPLYMELDFSFARELMAARGMSVVTAGARQPAEVHALVHLINEALENVGATITYTDDPQPERPHHFQAIRSLAQEIESGGVSTLVILGGNPAFDAPADLEFAARIAQVETTIHLSLYRDETSGHCSWHLPRAHAFECWGDGRSYTGDYTMSQPLMEPLHGGRSASELLDFLIDGRARSGRELVRETFADKVPGGSADDRWRQALHDGVVPATAWKTVRAPLRVTPWAERLKPHLAARSDRPEGTVELVFVAAAGILDGRFANNGWLQELPDPVTKLTWDNAVLMAPATAAAAGIEQGDMIRVAAGDRALELPVYVMPGQAEGSLAVALGYGRTAAGNVGNGVGVDVYPLRTGQGMGWADVTFRRTGRQFRLATTQDHYALDVLGAQESAERTKVLVREIDFAEYREHPHGILGHGHEIEGLQLWDAPNERAGYQWGMAIDLNACIGCNACVVACQAENNIPVVGKQEVINGREMHWIRIDRYFTGRPAEAEMAYQPVACQHCENAPCEPVCPVAATVHDGEGLNVMVYNRCVGTRYCSNNCPYKVRRFNYFNNHKHESAVEAMIYNPEVTVRSRGVMEKCTFCVQRINAAKIQAGNEGREVRDGEITTACEQACPTRAIAFGNLNDNGSRVHEKHNSDRSYGLLEEWNTRPRTKYQARVRNRNPFRGPVYSGTS